MPSSTPLLDPRPIRIGSLFSGDGGLDLAVEHAAGGETVWFSELNEPVARLFAHHWADAPNLGDITAMNWSDVTPVDVLCGGFPYQDVSTVGNQAGLAPGTRSGLWSHMAEAIDALQPRQVVIENVRDLLSARAIRSQMQGVPMTNATVQPPVLQPFALWNPQRGVWETMQPDLFGLTAPFSAIWPTCGLTHDGSRSPDGQLPHRRS